MRTRRSTGRDFAFRRTPLFAAIACALTQGALAGTLYNVTNGADSGAGSLRDAINQANANCATDNAPMIRFLGGPFTISPSTPLPFFQCNTNLSGYFPTLDATLAYGATLNSDPAGFNAVLPITLDGSSYSYGGCALVQVNGGYGGQLIVKGLDVRNFSQAGGLCGSVVARGNRFAKNNTGIQADDGSSVGGSYQERNVIVGSAGPNGKGILHRGGNVAITDNFIGTSDGVTADPNRTGIAFTGSLALPSGSIARNVIVSTYAGIDVGYDTLGISQNKIGTNAAGTSVLASSTYGIAIYHSYGSSIYQNTIGGAGTGIYLHAGSGDVSIIDNRIGVGSDGSTPIGNTYGIYDNGSLSTNIYGNAISGNASYGIWLSGSVDASVSGNFIGTNYGGTLAVPNNVGVYIGSAGTGSFSGNTISGNAGAGFWSSDASNISLASNYIGTTTGGASALRNGAEGLIAECGENLYLSSNTIGYNARSNLSLSAISNSTFISNTIKNGGDFEVPGNGVELTTSTCASPPADKRAGTKAAVAKSISPGYPNFSDNNNFTGNTIVGNAGHGVAASGASYNTFDSNVVTGNAGDGIRLDSDGVPRASTDDFISRGSNWGNGGKNINLASLASNNGQPRPTLSAVRDPSKGETMVTATLTAPPGSYRIELFSNSSAGKPAGEVYRTYGDLLVGVGGTGSVTMQVNDLTTDNFSATATNTEMKDTSEFADIYTVGAPRVPAGAVVPASINFGDVVVGRSSSPGTITVTSLGTADYVINALRDSSCTGTPICTSGGAFACSTSCLEATPYSNGMSCTITASFTPTATGAQNKTVALCDNTTSSPRTLTFSGNGVIAQAVDVVLAPSVANFGEVLVGTQSAASRQFVTTNMGSTEIYVGNVRTTGDFVLAGNTCGPTLAGGASCVTDVFFAPKVRGLAFERLEITASDAPIATPARGKAAAGGKVTTPLVVTASASLQGNGVQFGELRLPASIAFGPMVLRSSVRQQQLTITNTGNGALAIGAITVTGPFALANPCPATLAPNASCTLTLSFNPFALGSFNGTLNIATDAPGGVRAIPLSAQVNADERPVVRANPAVMGFGERLIGSESPANRVAISNDGGQVANLGALTLVQPVPGSSEYSIVGSTCSATLAPQATCFVDLALRPSGFGPRQGQLVIPSNSVDSPQVVNLGGTGCRPFAAGGNRSPRDPCAP